MNISDISLVITGLFFLINLGIGLREGVKIKTVQDYAVGQRDWSFSTLMMSFLATGFMGAMLFRTVNNFPVMGFAQFAAPIGALLFLPFRYIFLSRNTKLIQKSISTGDIIGNLYGRYAQAFSGLLSGIYGVIVLGMEIQVLSIVFENFFEINKFTALAISAFSISAYTAFGGIKAVLKTDVFQFLCLIIAVFLLTNICASKAGNLSAIVNNVINNEKAFFNGKFSHYFYSLSILECFFSAWFLIPHCFQRILMTKNSYQVKKLFLVGTISYIIFFMALAILAFSSLVILKNHDGYIIVNLIKNVVPGYFQGVIVVGLIAFIFSSGDSLLHISGLSFYYDFYTKLVNIKTPSIKALRIITFLTGILGAFFAIHGAAFFRVDYVMGAIAPTIFFPMTVGLLGIKTKANEFWISSIFGIVAFLIMKLNLIDLNLHNYSTLFATFLSTAIYIIVHIYNNSGFAWNRDMHNSGFRFFAKTESLLKKLSKPKSRFGISIRDNTTYTMFGVFYIVFILSSYLFWGKFKLEVEGPALLIKGLGLILCGLLVINDLWNYNLRKKYLERVWYITLIYCIPFLSVLMFILSEGSIEYTINISISLMFLLILTPWRIALEIIVIGSLLALLVSFYTLNISFKELSFNKNNLMLLIYQVLFGGSIGLIFSKRKSFNVDLVNFSNNFLNIINRRAGKEILDLKNSEDHFYCLLEKKEVNIMKTVEAAMNSLKEKNIDTTKEKLENIKEYIDSVAERSLDYMKLKPEKILLKDLAYDVEKLFSINGLCEVSLINLCKIDAIECDYIEFFRVITDMFNSFQEESLKESRNYKIYTTVYLTESTMSFSKENSPHIKEIRGIKITVTSADYLEDDVLYKKMISTLSKEDYVRPINLTDLSKNAAQKSLKAQYGVISDDSIDHNVTYSLSIPVNLYEIRDKGVDTKNK